MFNGVLMGCATCMRFERCRSKHLS